MASSNLKPWASNVAFLIFLMISAIFFCYVFPFGQKAGQNHDTNKILCSMMAQQADRWGPLIIQGGHYTCRFWLDCTSPYLTTPDTFRCQWILAPTGFWRGPKSIIFVLNQQQIYKKVSRNASWKNIIYGLMFDAKMGSLEKQKQAFRIITVAIYEVSRDH